ncbi:phage antirepressor KilAC domain-containing protein [Gilvimarinus agarilyticus]|uniref:phage antirepressor KilAC domain-containing protein n=1 Tax=Gilvimarinus agarilyticus TaxID=679259 RepID=UPI0005A0917E|nr:phage antirepressor KilAC domain-containing protein [Gilvimarinus agarilyticus]
MNQLPITVQKAAQQLGTGPVRLYRALREANILQSRPGAKNLPHTKYVHAGYFQIANTQYRTGPVTHNVQKTLVTPLGLAFIAEVLNGEHDMDTNGHLVATKQHRVPHQQNAIAR